jgi:hypothetical protein
VFRAELLTMTFSAAIAVLTLTTASAHGIKSPEKAGVPPAFDISNATAPTDGRLTTFAMEVVGAWQCETHTHRQAGWRPR